MTSFIHSPSSLHSLKERANAAQQQGPRRRARELALHLGVSECELVRAQYEGLQAQVLDGPIEEMFAALTTLGRVMALTRNDDCVHERHGEYQGYVSRGHVSMMLGPDIDLRAFLTRWRHAYAVAQDGRLSLQFFDAQGQAVHKVYCTAVSNVQAYAAYVARFRAQTDKPLVIEPAVAKVITEPKSSPEQIRAAWLALKDTHDFFPMLHKLGITRVQALEAAGQDLAQRVADDAVEAVLAGAVVAQLPIMCFVANPGMVQIHTGTVQNLRRTGDWFNVLDENFNLHLNTKAVAATWVVNKPTVDGWVRSLELYDVKGDQIVQFFGRRKEGQVELEGWRALLNPLCRVPMAS